MKYHLEITASAEKNLRKFDQKLQDRIIDKIFSLANTPRPFGSKKLHNSEYFRIRIGNYRAIYSINDQTKSIKILDLGHRKDIYKAF